MNDEERAKAKQEVLNLIPGMVYKPLFRRPKLRRELIMGFVGERGGGKSGTSAVVSLVDFMFSGFPVYSNMSIAVDITITDDLARQYGLKSGGVAKYRSIELDKEKLLQFDPMFTKCLIYLDEINVEFSDSRRSMTNTNLFFNRTGQELRHYESSMIYTVLDEMAIDNRLRGNTDIFCKVCDLALTSDGLERGKPPGIDFGLKIYPMTGYLLGHEQSYYVTHKAIEDVVLHFKPFRGIYNDKEVQGQGNYKYGVSFTKGGTTNPAGNMSLQDSPAVWSHGRDWKWFEHIVVGLLHSGDCEVQAAHVMQNPEVRAHQGLLPVKRWQQLVTEELKKHGIHAIPRRGSVVYQIPEMLEPVLA